MTRLPSGRRIVQAIILKDLRELARDRLWMLVGTIALLMFVALTLLLPESTLVQVSIGVHPSYMADLAEGADLEGIVLVPFDHADSLRTAVLSGTDDSPDLAAGVSFPPDLLISAGDTSTVVTVFLASGVSEHLSQAISSGVLEAVLAMRALASGSNPLDALPVTLPDMQDSITGGSLLAGLSLRHLLRPMLVMAILMIESLALAGLISTEIEQRTATALLVTPATAGNLLAAKWLMGAALAMVQVMVYLILTGMPWGSFPLIFVLLLLGAVMMSSVGMLSGAAGKGFMGTLFLGMLFIVPLMAPAVGLLYTGPAPLLMRLLPSSGLVNSLAAVLGGGAGWSAVMPDIAVVLAWDILLFAVSLLVLRRRMVTL